MTSPERHYEVSDTDDRTCDQHGEYLSKRFECAEDDDLRHMLAARQDRRGMQRVGGETLGMDFWTNCPACNDAYQKDADQAAIDASGVSEREARAERRREECGIPLRFAGATIWNWQHAMDKQQGIWAWCRDYAYDIGGNDRAGGRSVVFMGPPGTGKTHLAIGILAQVADGCQTGRYTTVMDMLGRVKDTYNHHSKETEAAVIRDLTTVGLLVIDEVGKQLDTNYESAQLFRVIDTRYRNLVPTIMISNLGRVQLAEFLGGAVLDRLRENGGKLLGFDWGSYRSKRKDRAEKNGSEQTR